MVASLGCAGRSVKLGREGNDSVKITRAQMRLGGCGEVDRRTNDSNLRQAGGPRETDLSTTRTRSAEFKSFAFAKRRGAVAPTTSTGTFEFDSSPRARVPPLSDFPRTVGARSVAEKRVHYSSREGRTAGGILCFPVRKKTRTSFIYKVLTYFSLSLSSRST